MPKLQLLPAVDVADGQAVRLVQGEAGSETSYGDPLDAALQWQRDGAEWVHLVDLDAAFGRGTNRELLAEVVRALDVKVEMSGGIRDDESLEAALATGSAVELFCTEAALDRFGGLIDAGRSAGVPVSVVTDRAIRGLSDTVTPTGIVAV